MKDETFDIEAEVEYYTADKSGTVETFSIVITAPVRDITVSQAHRIVSILHPNAPNLHINRVSQLNIPGRDKDEIAATKAFNHGLYRNR